MWHTARMGEMEKHLQIVAGGWQIRWDDNVTIDF
jgi:hypothetical protein